MVLPTGLKNGDGLMKHATLILAAVALLLGGAERVQADITFFDGTFNNADWTVPQSHDLLGAGQVAIGGNPNSYRQTRISFNEDIDYAAQVNTTFLYNPSIQGAITGLTWESDSITTNAFGGTEYLLIQQAGVLYFTPTVTEGSTSNVWLHFSRTVNPGDFTRVNPNSGDLKGIGSPDFTSTGSALDFGYLIQVTGGGFFTSDTGIDNYSLTVAANSAAPVVPEPTSITLLALGSLSLVGYGWRRRKASA
jgi:hypothetical protein